jgi:hypothetical protein
VTSPSDQETSSCRTGLSTASTTGDRPWLGSRQRWSGRGMTTTACRRADHPIPLGRAASVSRLATRAMCDADIALPNVAHMQTRPARADRREVDLRRLVAGFLRMAPDVAIVGEVRDRDPSRRKPHRRWGRHGNIARISHLPALDSSRSGGSEIRALEAGHPGRASKREKKRPEPDRPSSPQRGSLMRLRPADGGAPQHRTPGRDRRRSRPDGVLNVSVRL